MPMFGRIFANDEELGKKDDDRKRGKINTRSPVWSARKSPPWRRKRTVLYGLIACIALFLFFKNIPPPDHPPLVRPHYPRPPRDAPQTPPHSKAVNEASAHKPPRPGKPSEAENHYFNGPIRFYKLAVSLHAISRLRGHVEANKNVLFAASSLRSASELIPIACEMAGWDRNDVHFAFMGRDDLDMDEFKLLNGVGEECNVNWHDARPDFSPWSSDYRMGVSVSAGLGHIQTFMHPQAVIVDDPSREEGFFTNAIRGKALELGRALIELTTDAAENLMWITRLDSASLAAFHTTYVDILIHAPPHASGSLIRLLKSIENADYFNHRRPHLTIELPTEIDPPTADYLDELVWPPIDWFGAPHTSQVTLRHRIPRRIFTADEASMRIVESFYPARPADSHVLVLSPHVELSPLYFHFLMYHLLEYKYSSTSRHSGEAKNLIGLSLELPQTYLNESKLFTPPKTSDGSKVNEELPEELTPFLWQAPSSNAALYFGDKWVEFHSFLTSRLSLDPAKAPSRPKLISEMYPSWLEHLLELMRARGYALLYPNLPPGRESVASVHYELFHPPEEYSKPKPTSAADPPIPVIDPQKETFATDPSSHHPKQAESSPLTSNLLSLLPKSGTVQELFELPLLSHEGHELDYSAFDSTARAFTTSFRRQIGQCAATKLQPEVKPMKADDLFCDHDNDRSGLGLGDFHLGGPHRRPPKSMPTVKDDSEIRQNEFEAHLNRQAGKPLKAEEENSEESAKEEVAKTKESENGDAEDQSEAAANRKGAKEKAVKKESDVEDDKVEEDSDQEEDKGPDAEDLAETDTKTDKKAEKSQADDSEKDTSKKDVDEKAPVRDRGW
ncbi:MAG: hypothetical protein Q9218_000583 [Villophora microphyllina]